MPILKDFRKQIEITLPVTKGKVWIYDTLLAKDSLEIDKIYVSETSVSSEDAQTAGKKISIRASKYYEAMDETLRAMVAKWDFTADDGSELPPTIENIKKLPKKDFDFLQGEINKKIQGEVLTPEVKKN